MGLFTAVLSPLGQHCCPHHCKSHASVVFVSQHTHTQLNPDKLCSGRISLNMLLPNTS